MKGSTASARAKPPPPKAANPRPAHERRARAGPTFYRLATREKAPTADTAEKSAPISRGPLSPKRPRSAAA